MTFSWYFVSFQGAATEYVDLNNHNLLAALYGRQGFECVQYSEVVDHTKAKRKSYKINYDTPSLGWFKDPPPDELFFNPLQKEPDTFGTWEKTMRRPTTDRYFCPTSKDHKESFLSCPPSVCVDPKMRKLLESKPLDKSLPGGKILELPDPVFTKKHVPFKDPPLFTVTQHQAKVSLGNTAAMSQMCAGIRDYILDSWQLE